MGSMRVKFWGAPRFIFYSWSSLSLLRLVFAPCASQNVAEETSQAATLSIRPSATRSRPQWWVPPASLPPSTTSSPTWISSLFHSYSFQKTHAHLLSRYVNLLIISNDWLFALFSATSRVFKKLCLKFYFGFTTTPTSQPARTTPAEVSHTHTESKSVLNTSLSA